MDNKTDILAKQIGVTINGEYYRCLKFFNKLFFSRENFVKRLILNQPR